MKEGCNKFKEKYEDDYQCTAQLTAQHLQYIKLYPLQNVSPHVLPPPPSPPLLVESSFRTSKCEHLQPGTTNSFILPQMSTLATNAANV